MNIRKLLISCGGLLLFIFILNIFFGLFRWPLRKLCAYEAIPATTACIAAWENSEDLLTHLDSLSYLANAKALNLVQQLGTDYEMVAELFDAAFLNRQILHEARVVAAMQTSGSSEINFTILLDRYESKFKFQVFLSNLAQQYKVQAFKFKQHTIYSIEDEHGPRTVVTKYRNLLLFAKHAYMVEDAISQLKHIRTNLCRNRAFKATKSSSSVKNSIALYLNFENLPLLYTSFLKTQKWSAAQIIRHLGAWYRLDMSFQTDRIELTGRGTPRDTNRFYQHLQEQVSQSDKALWTVLPDHLAFLVRLGGAHLVVPEKMQDTLNHTTWTKHFLPWVDQTIGWGMTEPYSNELEAAQFALFKAKDTVLLRQHLETLSLAKGKTAVKHYQTYTIQRLLLNDVLQPIFGEAINSLQNPYCVVLDNYLVMSNSQSALEVWIDKFIAGQQLANQADLLALRAARQSPSSQIELLVHPRNLTQFFKVWIKPRLSNALDHDLDILSDMQQIHLAVDQKAEHLAISGTAHWAAARKKETRIVWKTNTTAPIRMAPRVVRDPQTGENEILVQDERNYLYLLSSNGKLRWKRLIDHPIISEIHQIDYYRNGQGQFLFNTKHKIFLLDREGKTVSSFPLRLQSEITNGVCVIESEDLRDYHFFVACKNRNIYGFNRSGNPLPGWNPKMGVGRLRYPLVHFQVSEKDYILALNEGGKLYAFKRNGTTLFGTKKMGGTILGPPDFQLLDGANRIVLGNGTGKAQIVNLQGEGFSLQVAKAGEENQQFVFTDFVGDERKDYLSLSGTSLSLYHYEGKTFGGKTIYDYDVPQDLIFPVALENKTKAYIGSLLRAKQQINLIDAEGQLYPGFPLAGTSKFTIADLFNNGKNILVVANGDSVYSYRLPTIQ